MVLVTSRCQLALLGCARRRPPDRPRPARRDRSTRTADRPSRRRAGRRRAAGGHRAHRPVRPPSLGPGPGGRAGGRAACLRAGAAALAADRSQGPAGFAGRSRRRSRSARSVLLVTAAARRARGPHVPAARAASGPRTSASPRRAAWPIWMSTPAGRRSPSWPGFTLLTERAPGRFASHELLHAYAAELADRMPAAQRRAATGRMFDHYLQTAVLAAASMERVHPIGQVPRVSAGTVPAQVGGRGGAFAWFEAERAVLSGVIRQAAGAGYPDHAWLLPMALREFYLRRGYWGDLLPTYEIALVFCAPGRQPERQAEAHRYLGASMSRLGLARRGKDAAGPGAAASPGTRRCREPGSEPLPAGAGLRERKRLPPGHSSRRPGGQAGPSLPPCGR